MFISLRKMLHLLFFLEMALSIWHYNYTLILWADKWARYKKEWHCQFGWCDISGAVTILFFPLVYTRGRTKDGANWFEQPSQIEKSHTFFSPPKKGPKMLLSRTICTDPKIGLRRVPNTSPVWMRTRSQVEIGALFQITPVRASEQLPDTLGAREKDQK